MDIVTTAIALVWLHFFADFILQSDKTATNKSKSNKVLSLHCMTYATPFLLYCVSDIWKGLGFAVINGVLHFAVDFATSRLNLRLLNKNRKLFFMGIGFDQAIHLTIIFLTAYWLGII